MSDMEILKEAMKKCVDEEHFVLLKYLANAGVAYVVFDIPSAKELDIYFRRDYSRVRVRSYHFKDYVSHFWGEYRTKNNFIVHKDRRILKSIDALKSFLDERN